MSGFIELCGPPGVGKSTLARALCGRSLGVGGPAQVLLSADLLDVVPRRGLGWFAPLLRDPVRVARLSRLPASRRLLVTRPGGWRERLDASGPAAGPEELESLPPPGADDPRAEGSYRTAALDWARETLHLARAAGDLPDRVVLLLDEGVVQRSVSLAGAGATEAARALVVERFPAPALVIQMVASVELLEQRSVRRLAAGSAPRLHAGMDAGRVRELVISDAAAIDATVRLIEARGVGIVRIPVDADARLRSLVANALDGIRERWPKVSS